MNQYLNSPPLYNLVNLLPGGAALVCFIEEHDSVKEQLALYVRALQVLASSLKLAQEEVSADRLQATSKLKYCLYFLIELLYYIIYPVFITIKITSLSILSSFFILYLNVFNMIYLNICTMFYLNVLNMFYLNVFNSISMSLTLSQCI